MADATLKAVITAEDRASKVIAQVGDSLDGVKSKLGTALEFTKKAGLALAAFGTVAAGFAARGVQVAGQLEAMEQGFVTLLGSSEAARKTMARIKEEAARTPFELPGLTSATQALALVTKDGDKAINVLLDVGKALAAAGKGQAELDRIIANLQQIALTGQITEMDIRQFGMNGINILELLADHYGTTTEKASEMVKNSKDAFGDLTAAFQQAGAEGGKFADGFANQAGTFQQLWSNLMDSINIGLSDLVKSTGIFDLVKKAIEKINEVIPVLVEWLKGAVDWLKELASKFNQAIEIIQRFIDKILATEVARNIIDQLKASFDSVWTVIKNNLYPALQELWAVIKESLYPALKELWAAVQPLVPYFETWSKIIGAVLVLALLLLIKTITTVIEIVAKLLTKWAEVWTWIIEKGSPAIKGFADTIETVANAFMNVFNWVGKAISKVGEFTSKISNINLNPLSGNFNLFGRASGGSVSPQRSFIVGENGPEIFTPNTYGQISTGGAAITINITDNTFMGREGIAEQIGNDIMRALKRNKLL